MSTSRKVFTMSADCSECQVIFGILNSRAWVTVVRDDGESICSLDNKSASRVASMMLSKDLWPEFARHLFDAKSSQRSLF